MSRAPRRIIVGISGASGAVYGARLLQALREMEGVQSHLVVSDAGWRNLRHELDMERADVQALADVVHDLANVGASIASGSFAAHGMVVAPCSMRTLAAIAHGLADNLLTRESPLHLVHLRNMATVTELGGVVCPPMPAFYLRPTTIGEIVDHSVARALDLLGLEHNLAPRWTGLDLDS